MPGIVGFGRSGLALVVLLGTDETSVRVYWYCLQYVATCASAFELMDINRKDESAAVG